MTELQRRLLITAGAVCAAVALYFAPIPGVIHLRVGGLGLAPYMGASILAAMFALIRSGPTGTSAWVPRVTLVLAVALAILMSISSAATVNAMTRLVNGVGLPGPEYWMLIIGTMTAGALLLVLLSHAISVRGIGNGVCILVSAQLISGTISGFVRAASDGNAFGENPLLVLLLVAGWVALLLNWMHRRWAVQGATTGLHVNGIGNLGFGFAFSLMAVLIAVQGMFPPGSRVYSSLQWIGDMRLPYYAAFVVLSIVAGAFWTAQVYDARGLSHAPRAMPDSPTTDEPAEDAFDRQVSRATGSYVILSPIVVAILLFAFPRLGVAWLSPLMFLPVVATILDTADQWRVHGLMARSEPTAEQALCEHCGQPVEADASHCAACGTVFDEGVLCGVHADRPAFARCILCSRGLCDACDHASLGRHLCAEHRFHDLVEGWVTVARAETRLSGEARAAALCEDGIRVMMLANDPSPLYGTTGLYDMRSVIPLAVHPTCGGGTVRVLVPAAQWKRVSARGELDPEEPTVSAAGST